MFDATIRLGYNDAAVQSGIARTSARTKQFAQETEGLFSKVRVGLSGAMSSGLGALGVGLSAAGVKALMDQFDRMGDLAQQLDTAPESVQRIGAMAKLSASDVESVVKALHKVNKEIAAGKAGGAFKELGIDVGRFKAMAPEEQILTLAQAFQNAEAKGRGLAQAYDLFGKSAADLLPLLRSNVDQLKEAANVKILTEEQMAAIGEFNDRFDVLVMNTKAGLAAMALDTWTAVGDMVEAFRHWSEATDGSVMDHYMEGKWKRQADAIRAAADAANKRSNNRDAAAKTASKDDEKAKSSGKYDLVGKLKKELEEERKASFNESASADEKKAAALKKLAEWERVIANAKRSGNEALLLAALTHREKLTRQIDGLEKDITEEKRKQASVRDDRLQSIRDLEVELRIMQMRARGQDKQADALERENRIRQEAARIARETGISGWEALKIAQKKADLEDRANRRSGGMGDGMGARRKIYGYSHAQRETNPYLERDELTRHRTRAQGNFFEQNQRTPGLDSHSWKRQGGGSIAEGIRTIIKMLAKSNENTAGLQER